MAPPMYVVKPANIFKHPFNRLDLEKSLNRQAQNDDLTDYFNYGFNQDTFNIYGKLVKRQIEVLDESINPTYFDAPSELMRLNDQIPMDFGGFCKFFDPSIFVNTIDQGQQDNQTLKNFHNGQELLKNLIYMSYYRKSAQAPLIQFVKSLYRTASEDQNWMCDVMDQIELNLEKKYQETMKKIYEKKNNPTGTAVAKDDREGENAGRDRANRANFNHDDRKHNKEQVKKEEEPEKMKNDQSASQSESSESQSKSASEEKEKKKNKDKHKRSRSRSSKKDKRNKHKKIKKQDKKDKKDKQKHKQKSHKRSKDRSRSHKKDKSKKRRN